MASAICMDSTFSEPVEGSGIGLGKLMEHTFGHHGVAMDAVTAPLPSSPEGEVTKALGLDLTGFDDTFTNLF